MGQEGRAPAAQDGVKPARLLVVDDEPSILAAVRRLLRGEYEVITHADPHQALALLASGEPIDGVVCDLTMPRLNGRELYEQAVAVRPGIEERFVFVSGGTFSETLRAFAAAQAHRLVAKPFDLDRLREQIRRVAGR